MLMLQHPKSGAFFDYHPALQNATVDVIGPSHPSTAMLPTEWHVQDEMFVRLFGPACDSLNPNYFRYNFKSDPRDVGAIVILSANESSYVGELCSLVFLDFIESRTRQDTGTRNFNQGSPHPTGKQHPGSYPIIVLMRCNC